MLALGILALHSVIATATVEDNSKIAGITSLAGTKMEALHSAISEWADIYFIHGFNIQNFST